MFFFKDKQGLWRRRNYFIKKEFQVRFIARFLGVVAAGSAASGYIMYLLVNREVSDTFYTTHIKAASTGEMFLPAMLKVNIGVLVPVLAGVILLTLIISHKVAGPLLRLGRDTEKIARRDFTGDFRLRAGDELGSLAQSFEEMNEELKKRFNELREQAEEISRAAEGLARQQTQGDGGPALGERVERLSEDSAAFGRKLSGFKTGNEAGGKA